MRAPTTILLVDDEPGIRRSLGEALKDEGYQVVKAERGEQAIDLLHNPDGEGLQLMLLDVWLPGQDGLETLKQAKQIRPQLPVVMISGHASIDTAMQATKLGAFDFLEKPIDLAMPCASQGWNRRTSASSPKWRGAASSWRTAPP